MAVNNERPCKYACKEIKCSGFVPFNLVIPAPVEVDAAKEFDEWP